jgi:HemY protein
VFKLFILLVAAAISVFAFPELAEKSGELNLIIADFKISLPVVAAVLLLVAASFVLVGTARILAVVGRFFNILLGTDKALATSMYNKAMIEQGLGNYASAQKMFLKAARGSQTPVLNYLQAAKCAHSLKNSAMRDKLIMQCYQKFIDNSSLINFQYAQMCFNEQDYEKSLALLSAVEVKKVNLQQYLQLKAQLLFNLQKLPALLELLPEITRRQVFVFNELKPMQVAAYGHALQHAGENLHKLWHDIPKHLKSNELIAMYVRCLNGKNPEEAQVILRKAIDNEYNSDLVLLYADVKLANIKQQIAKAQEWYQVHANDPALNLCLGKLCFYNKLWGQSREYIEKSLGLKFTSEALVYYIKLGSMFGEQGNKIEFMEKALKLLE